MKNELLLQALKGEIIERPPVWMMRQAGRYLPDFMKLKDKFPEVDFQPFLVTGDKVKKYA